MTTNNSTVTGLPVEMGAAPGQSWLVSRDTVDMTRKARPLRAVSIAAEPQNIILDANKTALLIVDMQNDFCSKGGWLDSRGIDVSPNRKPIAPLKTLVEFFRRRSIPVIWVNWGVRKDLLNIHPSLRHAHSPRGDEPGLAEPVPGTRSEVISRGSWGAEVVDEIHPGTQDIQIVKHRFSCCAIHRRSAFGGQAGSAWKAGKEAIAMAIGNHKRRLINWWALVATGERPREEQSRNRT